MDPQPHQKTGWVELLKRTGVAWNEDKALRLGAALAYYTVFSIGPLLVITLGIAGLVLGKQAVTGQLHDHITAYVGSSAAAAVQAMVESASQPASGRLATSIGFVALMLGAAGVFGELKDALNTIWGVKPKPGFGLWSLIGEKFMNFGMVLAIGFLLLTSLVLSTVVAGLGTRFSQVLALPPFVWAWVTFGLSLAMVTTLFAMIFKILPDVHIRWRDVWVGAGLTAVLFEIGKTALSWYLARESTTGAYGAASSVVLLLLWVYYASCIMFFGAEFTRIYAQAHGQQTHPEAHAEEVTGEERAQQGLGPSPRQEQMPSAAVREHPGRGLISAVLKYARARSTLAGLEAREAMGQAIGILMLVAIGMVAIFAAWLLLATALVGLLTIFAGLSWLQAVAIAGGAHFLVIVVVATLIRQRLHHADWFADTIDELRRDRAWLRSSVIKP